MAERVNGLWPVIGDPVLSPRERDVLALVARGLTNRAVAEELYVSVETVRTHVSRILRKLGVENRTQAALYAVQAQGQRLVLGAWPLAGTPTPTTDPTVRPAGSCRGQEPSAKDQALPGAL